MIDLAGLEREQNQPLFDNSHRLRSLWEMLKKYAWYFFILSDLLRRLHRDLGLPLPPAFNLQGLGSLGGLLPPPPTSGIGGEILPLQPPTPSIVPSPNTLTADEREEIRRTLGFVETARRGLGMTGIMKDVERAKADASLLFTDRNKMQFHIEHVTERIIDELEQETFHHVPSDKDRFYHKDDLFGVEIGKKFPKAREDLTNAGTSYAVGLNTACVFHLMRVMEHCVQRFGRKLQVSIDVNKESWATIMDHVNNAVKALPGGRHTKAAQSKKKERYSLAAARLDHVRIVSRNDTMHPKATYDEKEATEILT